jgi:hypothetical protein
MIHERKEYLINIMVVFYNFPSICKHFIIKLMIRLTFSITSISKPFFLINFMFTLALNLYLVPFIGDILFYLKFKRLNLRQSWGNISVNRFFLEKKLIYLQRSIGVIVRWSQKFHLVGSFKHTRLIQ